MVPVRNGFEVYQRSSISADLSFYGMESPSDDVLMVRDDGGSLLSNGFEGARVPELDFVDLEDGDGVRVSGSEVMTELGTGQQVQARQEAVQEEAGWMNGFKVGDMVWGKVKSHPWWPGHIFKEAFASSSVRRTKREGHVLVAFFGDSSYGWFDPAELIPYEPHFAEKSKQTTSRHFVKAVEESVDEARRRGALALACRCRNKDNFRPTAVPGYFAVDISGFENGGVYSAKQIEKARSKFVSPEMLSFLHQLALAPQRNDSDKSVECIQSISMLIAFRRAVFEEFDETYAQAFGVQPVRPARNKSGMLEKRESTVFRAAPLSGPLVIAESLGDKKGSNNRSSTKASKSAAAAAASKKNKYVLKRRDEASAISSFNLAPGPDSHASLVIPHLPAFRDAASGTVPGPFSDGGSYVLQKRPSEEKPQDAGEKHKDATPGGLKMVAYPASVAAGPRSVREDFDDWMMKSQQTAPQHQVHTEKPMAIADVTVKLDRPEVVLDRQQEIPILITDSKDASLEPMLELPSFAVGRETVDIKPLPAKHQDLGVVPDGSIVKKKEDKAANLDGGEAKKQKVRKRLPDGSEGLPEKKKKKKIETIDIAAVIPKAASEFRKRKQEPIIIETDVGRTTVQPHEDLNSLGVRLPHVLTVLRELALDPFYETESNELDAILKAFLMFRSVVYQKSLVVPLLISEAEPLPPPPPAAKPDSSRLLLEPPIGDGDVASIKGVKEQREPIVTKKPFKHPLRPNDPTKAGRKRPPSDRQEEEKAKRIKKLDKLKTLSSERKAAISQKASELPKQATEAAPAKPVKKNDCPRVLSPTFLVMKFPPRSSLPSISSLKARFGRFGQLELSGTRVHWKSYTCKVLFKYKQDAEVARDHIKGNNLFGQVKVQCYLREGEQPAPEEPPPKPEIRPGEDPPFRPGNGNGGPAAQPRPISYQQQMSSVQPKSILKKPGDEATVVPRESSRVKFRLEVVDLQEDVAAAHPLGPSPRPTKSSKSINFLPPAPFPSHPRPNHASASQPSHVTKAYQSPVSQPSHIANVHQFQLPVPLPSRASDMNNFTTLPPPPPPPMQQLPVPLPPPPPLRSGDDFQTRGFDPRTQPLQRPQIREGVVKESSNVDVSVQMMNLLLKCSDIVASLKASFGYVPYHGL